MGSRLMVMKSDAEPDDGVLALHRVLKTLPLQARLELAAQIVEDAAYDQAGVVDPQLIGKMIDLAARIGMAGRRH